MGQDCLFTRKRRNDRPVVHERREGKAKHPDRGKASVAIVHIAKHHSRITSGMPSQFETSRNTRAIHNAHERHLTLRRKVPSEKISIILSRQSLERAKFRDKCPSLKVIQTGSKNARHFNAPPCESTEWNVKQEEFARQKAHKLQEALFKIKSTLQRCPQNKLLFKLRPCKGKEHHDSLSDTFQRRDCLWLCGLRHASNELGCSYWWPSGETSRNAASKTWSPWLQLPNRRLYHPLSCRQLQETLSEKKKWRTPCWLC